MGNINSATVSTTTPALSDYAFVNQGGAFRRITMQLLGACIGFLQGGTGATTRTVQDKLREAHISVMDFGATRGATSTPGTASDTAFVNALAWAASSSSLTSTVNVPSGFFRLANPLDLPPNVTLQGGGIDNTTVNCYTTSTANGGMITMGLGAVDHDPDSLYTIKDIRFQYLGTSTSTALHGLLMTHKCSLDKVSIEQFPGDCIRVDSYWKSGFPAGTAATDYGPDNSVLTECSTQGGNVGYNLRYACRNITLYNCQGRNANTHGLVHSNDGGVCSGCLIIGGQMAYCNNYGYNWIGGSNLQVYAVYAEGNKNHYANNTQSYADSDFNVGNGLTYSWINIGTIFNHHMEVVTLPTVNTGNTQVWTGGVKLYP